MSNTGSSSWLSSDESTWKGLVSVSCLRSLSYVPDSACLSWPRNSLAVPDLSARLVMFVKPRMSAWQMIAGSISRDSGSQSFAIVSLRNRLFQTFLLYGEMESGTNRASPVSRGPRVWDLAPLTGSRLGRGSYRLLVCQLESDRCLRPQYTAVRLQHQCRLQIDVPAMG